MVDSKTQILGECRAIKASSNIFGRIRALHPFNTEAVVPTTSQQSRSVRRKIKHFKPFDLSASIREIQFLKKLEASNEIEVIG